jgi:hypothetical protein
MGPLLISRFPPCIRKRPALYFERWRILLISVEVTTSDGARHTLPIEGGNQIGS